MNGAFATSTARSYNTIRLCLAFLTFHQQLHSQVNVFLLLAFFEFLHLNDFKYSNILNHFSAIKSKLSLFGQDVSCFQDHRISTYLKAIQKQSPLSVTIKPIFDIPILQKICIACDSTFQGQVFKVAYLLGFFGFLRLSNLCPHSLADFNILKQDTKGLVSFFILHELKS